MAAKIALWNILLWFGFLMQGGTVPFVSGRMTGNILTNEVIDTPDEEVKDVPLCRAGSACGYLQVNAFGINKNQFCSCPSLSNVCPLHWDNEDGHSITMGSQQFKYCGRAPALKTCTRLEPAYTSAYLFEQSTFDVLGVVHSLHCFCPAPRVHVNDGNAEDVLDNMLMLGSIHKCKMMPICEPNGFCKELSFSTTSSLVTEKCKCPRGHVCPTLSYDVTANSMNNNFSNGKAFSVRCQSWI